MTILDLIVPGQPYRPRRHRWDIDTVVQSGEDIKAADSVNSLPSGGQEVVDTVNAIPANTDAVADSVNSSQLAPSLMDRLGGGDDSSVLLWAIVAVLFALAICLYFVYTYRRMLKGTRRV